MDIDTIRSDWRFTAGLISGGHFFSHLLFLAFPPLFPLLGPEFGLTNTQLGLLLSVMGIGGLLQAPVGELVDRTGAKRIFVAGIALTSAGLMLASTASTYLMLLGFAAVSGLGQAAFHPAGYAMLNAVTSEETKGKSFSLHMFTGFAGFAAAPVVFGVVGLRYSWRVALLAVGAAGLLYAIATAVTLESHYLASIGERASTGTGDSLRDSVSELVSPAILTLFLFFVMLLVAQSGIQAFTTVLATEHFGTSEVVGNTALTAYFTLAAFGVLVGGVLADQYAPRHIIGLNLALAAVVVWVGVSGVVSLAGDGVVGLLGITGVLTGLVLPARDRLVSSFATAGSTGKSFGFVFTGLTIGGMVGPALLGAVIDTTTVAIAFVVVGAAYLVSAGIATSFGTTFIPTTATGTEADGD
ncbi:MAG: MFS transporter [Halobacteriota archaeon]